MTVDPHGGLAERRGNGLQSRVHGFESRTHLAWAIGAAGARFPDTEEVTGSIPVSPTKRKTRLRPGLFVLDDGAAGSLAVGFPGIAGSRPKVVFLF